MTNIRTQKRSYRVVGVEHGALVVRQGSGKRRLLTVAEVGKARFYAAAADYWASKHRAEDWAWSADAVS